MKIGEVLAVALLEGPSHMCYSLLLPCCCLCGPKRPLLCVAVTLLLLLTVGGLVAILLLQWETVSVTTVRETAQHWWRGLASTK